MCGINNSQIYYRYVLECMFFSGLIHFSSMIEGLTRFLFVAKTIALINISLLGCCTRILCSLMKLNSKVAKITIPPLTPSPHPLPNYGMNELTKK